MIPPYLHRGARDRSLQLAGLTALSQPGVKFAGFAVLRLSRLLVSCGFGRPGQILMRGRLNVSVAVRGVDGHGFAEHRFGAIPQALLLGRIAEIGVKSFSRVRRVRISPELVQTRADAVPGVVRCDPGNR